MQKVEIYGIIANSIADCSTHSEHSLSQLSAEKGHPMIFEAVMRFKRIPSAICWANVGRFPAKHPPQMFRKKTAVMRSFSLFRHKRRADNSAINILFAHNPPTNNNKWYTKRFQAIFFIFWHNCVDISSKLCYYHTCVCTALQLFCYDVLRSQLPHLPYVNGSLSAKADRACPV